MLHLEQAKHQTLFYYYLLYLFISLFLYSSFNVLYILGTCVNVYTYRVGCSIYFTPCPGGMWVTNRLAVQHCIFPLVFIFTSLVAGDIRFCCKGKIN